MHFEMSISHQRGAHPNTNSPIPTAKGLFNGSKLIFQFSLLELRAPPLTCVCFCPLAFKTERYRCKWSIEKFVCMTNRREKYQINRQNARNVLSIGANFYHTIRRIFIRLN